MSDRSVSLSVCICTYQRPELLQRLLQSLAAQTNTDHVKFSVVVADNDAAESGRATVEAFRGKAPFELIYCVEPRKNIALVRNCAIANAPGEYLAFIDDDEFGGAMGVPSSEDLRTAPSGWSAWARAASL